MGRVERRMYRKKRKGKRLRVILLLGVALLAAAALWHGKSGRLIAEYLALPTATPLTSAFDRTVESREITLVEETWYAIQTGVFSTSEAAAQKADAYADRGAPGTVVEDGEKWRVFIACYGTEADASAVRTRLEQNQRVDTYLYAWKCPELRLRLTGMAGQLDAVEAGFTLMISTAAALRDTAIQLDAAQLTTQEAKAAVEALSAQISLWEETIRSRFGKSLPPLVEGMQTVMQGWTVGFGEINAARDATALSAAIKAEAMGAYDDIVAWRNQVAAQ